MPCKHYNDNAVSFLAFVLIGNNADYTVFRDACLLRWSAEEVLGKGAALEGLGSAVSSPSGVGGGAPTAECILDALRA